MSRSRRRETVAVEVTRAPVIGAWWGEGRRLAFVVILDGDERLEVLEFEDGSVVTYPDWAAWPS